MNLYFPAIVNYSKMCLALRAHSSTEISVHIPYLLQFILRLVVQSYLPCFLQFLVAIHLFRYLLRLLILRLDDLILNHQCLYLLLLLSSQILFHLFDNRRSKLLRELSFYLHLTNYCLHQSKTKYFGLGLLQYQRQYFSFSRPLVHQCFEFKQQYQEIFLSLVNLKARFTYLYPQSLFSNSNLFLPQL